MKVIHFNGIREFQKQAFDFLEKHEAENCLILSLLDRIKDNLHLFSDEDPRFYIVEDNGVVLGSAMQTPPHNLILSYPFEHKAIVKLANFMSNNNHGIPGVFAGLEEVKVFADYWENLNNCKGKLLVKERVFKLDSVENETMQLNGREFQQANESDLEHILNWLYDFNSEAVIEFRKTSRNNFINEQKNRTKDAIIDGQFFFLTEKGEKVCMARTPGRTPHGRVVNYVYTPPEFRKKGHATVCVAHLSKKILDEGYKYCMLFTDLANPTSNSIYQKIGYRGVLDVNMIEFNQ